MRIVILTLAAAGIAITFFAPLTGFVLVAPLLIALLHPSVQWLGPVLTRYPTDAKEVWLTIDDGPTDDTIALLDLLDRCDVRATFFVKGVHASERDVLVLASARGRARDRSVQRRDPSHDALSLARRIQEHLLASVLEETRHATGRLQRARVRRRGARSERHRSAHHEVIASGRDRRAASGPRVVAARDRDDDPRDPRARL